MTIDSLSELLAWQPGNQDEIISDGILLPQTTMLIFGGAKAWKSILALHLGFCIATGNDWFGFKTKQSTVFKYQVELPKAVDRKRVIKYMNGSKPHNIFFKTAPYSKIDTGYGKQSLERDIVTVQSRRPDTHIVLILDPIYLLITGHISDDYDIKKLLDNLSEIKDKHKISTVLIHHTHKTRVDSSGNIIDLGSEEVMGSSYFNNYADTMVRVKLLDPYTGKKKVRISFELTRHAESLLPTIDVEWSRRDLRPTVLHKEMPSEDDVSFKGLTD